MARVAGLDRARIVATCLALADDDGIDRLSMRRISAELGVSTMAIYHHVANKDELLDMVADESLVGLPEIDRAADPRAAVVDWTCAFYGLLVDHPGLAQVIGARRLEGPVAVRTARSVLEALQRLGLDEECAVELLVALVSFALGGSLYKTSRSAVAARRGERRIVADGASSASMRARLATAGLADDQFRVALGRLLAGYVDAVSLGACSNLQ